MADLFNSTTQSLAEEAVDLFVQAIAIIGFVLSIIGFGQSGLFMHSAMMGLGKGPGYTPPPRHWGVPWEFSLATGLEGPKQNQTYPLCGAQGPFPKVYLFNDVGEYLGHPKRDTNLYIGDNEMLALDIFPNNVDKHEGQQATYVILEANPLLVDKDPLCIVDFGLQHPRPREDSPGSAFSAFTALSCGASWYHSGVYRNDIKGSVPCFWLGGYGVHGMQVHLPSHTVGQSEHSLADMNKTLESAHEYFCNRPGALSLWSKMPPSHEVPDLLVTDLNKRGNRTLKMTQAMHRGNRLVQEGTSYVPWKPPRSVEPPPHQDTLTVAHELQGLSASALCQSGSSVGPDFVNIIEGKFCRMSDKTLWPTCNHRSRVGPTDDCFDVDSRQLVVGGKVTHDVPYLKEMNFPLK